MSRPRGADGIPVSTAPDSPAVERLSGHEAVVSFGAIRVRLEIDVPPDGEVVATTLSDVARPVDAERPAPAPPPQNRWLDAHSALRRGHYQEAINLFEAEAEVAEAKGDHARAAVAYRTASGAAEAMGREDLGNHLIRLAGKHYLFVAESASSSSRATLSSYVTAAKCFLQAGNLELAGDCIERAKTVERVLDVSVNTWNGRTSKH